MTDRITRRDFRHTALACGAALFLGVGEARSQEGRLPTSRRAAEPRVRSELRRLLPDIPDQELDWLAIEYSNTAINVAREHGRQGIDVLLALGQQGLVVMREQPDTFRQVAHRLGGKTAAGLLIALHPHFEELAKLGGLPALMERIEALPRPARRLGDEYPSMLPFLVLAPDDASEALRRHKSLCLMCFPALDLSKGPDALIQVSRLIRQYGQRAEPWVQARGLDGLLLLDAFAAFLDRVPPVDLPAFLTILSTNQGDLAPRMAGEDGAERVWSAILDVIRRDGELPNEPGDGRSPAHGDLIQLAGIDPHTIRLIMDRGGEGLRLIEVTWPEAVTSGVPLPSLLYDGYHDPAAFPKLTDNTWGALARVAGRERETFQMLLLMAPSQNNDLRVEHPRSERFRRLLAELDYRVVAYLAEAELDEPSAPDRYARLEERRLDELNAWEYPTSFWVQNLPLYDTVHLGWLVAKGYTPTQGELIFAGVDVVFTAWDLASLGAGKAATSIVKGGIKTGNQVLARKVLSEVAEDLATQGAKFGAKSLKSKLVADLAGQMASTPKFVSQMARAGQWRDVGVSSAYAARSAARMNVPLAVCVVGKYFAREWTKNAMMNKTAMAVIAPALVHDNWFWVEKTREVLLYLNRKLEKPLK